MEKIETKTDIWIVQDPEEYFECICKSEKAALSILKKWKAEDYEFGRTCKYIGPLHFRRVD